MPATTYTAREGERPRAKIGPIRPRALPRRVAGLWRPRGTYRRGKNDPRLMLTAVGLTVGGLLDAYPADPEKVALRSKAEIAA